MTRQRAIKYKYDLLLIDLISLNFSFASAQIARFSGFIKPQVALFGQIHISVNLIVFFFFSLFAVFIFHLFGLYKIQMLTNRFGHTLGLLQALFTSAIFYAFLNYITKLNYHFTDSRLVLIYWPSFSLVLLIILRVFFYPIFHRYVSKVPFNKRRMLVIGDADIVAKCVTYLEKNQAYGCQVVAALKIKDEDGKHEDLEIYSFEKASDIIDKFAPTDLFVALRDTSTKNAISIISKLHPSIKNIEFTSLQYERLATFIRTDKYCDIPVFSLGMSPYFFWYKYFKRAADLFLSLFIIALSLPLLATLWALIKISSDGPGIISQPRVGKNGKRFNFYKFRTMRLSEKKSAEKRNDAYIEAIENENNVISKIVDKKRITWIGSFLRATALDEVPQFFNVLKNDMSLVGPRPCLLSEYLAYDDWHKKRYSIKPGCTGIWQVLKSRGLSFSDTILLDLIYAHSVSPWLDLQLVLNTLLIMITGSADK
ncbi:exopolysaccharide biosynthesis polyprenyl glycosylphosphotransferase [candidate division WOR-3 bacterium]|nr:exopolysaccharide biosynthesis polyprenyl glycosylphosphotransferase [candidate division WOR-3 bacterium]